MAELNILKPAQSDVSVSATLVAASPDAESLGERLNSPEPRITPKSMLQRVIGSVSVLGFVDQGVVSVASFAAAAFVGRACGSEQLGVYSLAVSLFWLVAGIPNALVWIPYTSRAPHLSPRRRQRYLGSVTVHLAVVALLISLVLVVAGVAPLLGLVKDQWFLPMCAALVPFTVLMLLREHLRRVLLAEMNTAGLLRLDVPIAVSQLLILVALSFSGHLSAVTALVGMAFACLWGGYWVVKHRERFCIESRRVKVHWGHNFQFGKWLVIVSVAWLLGDASYRGLVGSLHGWEALGQYSAAVMTVMFLNPIMLTVQNLARTILANSYAQGKRGSLWSKTVQGTGIIALGFGILFSVLAIYGGELVDLFFGGEFSGLGSVVASLCLGMYLHVLISPVEAALAALQDGRSMLVASLLRLGLVLLAGIPLITTYGPLGVGFAMAVGALGAGIYQWYLFCVRCRHAS